MYSFVSQGPEPSCSASAHHYHGHTAYYCFIQIVFTEYLFCVVHSAGDWEYTPSCSGLLLEQCWGSSCTEARGGG